MVSACQKPTDSIGEAIQPEGDLMNAFQTDTTTLHARTLKIDSVASDFYSNIMIGNYVDDVFGVVRTTGIMQFIPSTSQPRYGTLIRVDSVVLSLVYQNATYGKNVPMYFNVREVLDNLQYDSTYYNHSSIATAPHNLMAAGMEVLDPRPELSTSQSTGNRPALRLHLNKQLGEKLLTADTDILDDKSLFKSFFRGLAVSSETVDGQVINYVKGDPDTKLRVYYANLDGTEEVLNTADFIIANNSCKAFTLIDQHYYGTDLQGLSSTESIDGSQLAYMQSGGGTRVAVNISSAKWLNQIQGVTINRAELIIPYDKAAKFLPISTFLVFYKPEGQSYYSSANTGGIVNASSGLYRINITNHLQSYLAGTIKSDEIILQPDYVLTEFSNSWSVRRSLIHGPQFNPQNAQENMRLVITYSY